MRRAVFMRPPMTVVRLRLSDLADLAALNTVIGRAVMSWQLPAHAIIGVAAWEPANPRK